MSDPIDDAARAFQTEIAPNERPRGDDGRFQRMSESQSRPEPIFQERRLEGDPLTGDTRDGGEDARLMEIERRVADGRGQEGDVEELRRSAVSNDASKRRPASGDDRHQRQADEQGGRDDGEQQSDQDAERPHGEGPEAGEGDAEREPERDSEARFKVTTLEGEPVTKFEITVDGRPEEVTLEEALDGYIKDATFKTRLNKVADERRQVEALASEVSQWRDVYVQRLQALDRELNDLTPAEPDWDKEFALDPKEAYQKRKAYDLIYGKRQAIAQEMNRSAQEAKQEYDRNIQTYAVRQFEEFVSECGFKDKKELDEALGLMREYAKKEGFTDYESATVYDKRMLRVLYNGALYNQAQVNRPKPVISGKGRTLIPGAAAPIGNATRRHIDDAQTRLARSGKLEDATQVMARLIR